MKSDAIPVKCSVCGADDNPADASNCRNCGESLEQPSRVADTRIDRPASSVGSVRKKPRQTPPFEEPSSSASSPSPRKRGSASGAKVETLQEGTVNRFETRASGELQTWTFLLEGVDASGRASNILVQSGPSLMNGSLHNGDRVQVTGGFKDGVFHAHRLFCESSGAFVGPRPPPPGQKVFLTVVLLMFVLVPLFGLLGVISDRRQFGAGWFGSVPILILLGAASVGVLLLVSLWRKR